MSLAPLLPIRALERRGVRAGFTCKVGGVSRGPLASLNLARRPGERTGDLEENWARVVRALDPGWTSERLALLEQVHGRAVVRVEAPGGALTTLAAADAAVTTQPGVVLAVRVADCVPVLLSAPGGVAAVHSGWRGTAQGVVPAAVAALREATGASAGELVAAIGPHISQDAYEVGEEVVEALAAAGLTAARFCQRGPQGRARVDLGEAVAEQLERAGVSAIERTRGCTASDPRFFSHRAEGDATGRQAGVIALAA